MFTFRLLALMFACSTADTVVTAERDRFQRREGKPSWRQPWQLREQVSNPEFGRPGPK
jgi:hypothetical protein